MIVKTLSRRDLSDLETQRPEAIASQAQQRYTVNPTKLTSIIFNVSGAYHILTSINFNAFHIYTGKQ